jgi:hypothetical protein
MGTPERRINLTEFACIETEFCPLCRTQSPAYFKKKYFCCPECSGIFMATQFQLTPEKEKSRYETHNNDVNDRGYQSFVEPIVNSVMSAFSPDQRGLDFGAGPGPVIASLLTTKGYNIALYDPFFHNNTGLLQQTYDYIVCCEVIEHFYQPAEEFRRLHNLLKTGGRLICMTLLYNEKTDFSSWFYKNDETHVFFYQAATLAWIEKNFGFCNLSIDGRLVEFACK